MRDLTDGYLRTVARSVGVLPFWVEDCVQEMRIALWQAGETKYPRTVAKNTAIDFVRKVNHFRRSDKTSPQVYSFTSVEAASRAEGVSLLDSFEAQAAPIDEMLDCRALIGRLMPHDQRLVGALARGETQVGFAASEGISESRVSQLVKRVRERLSA